MLDILLRTSRTRLEARRVKERQRERNRKERQEWFEAWSYYRKRMREQYPVGSTIDYLGAKLRVISNERPAGTHQMHGRNVVYFSATSRLKCHYRDNAGLIRDFTIEGEALTALSGIQPPTTKAHTPYFTK